MADEIRDLLDRVGETVELVELYVDHAADELVIVVKDWGVHGTVELDDVYVDRSSGDLMIAVTDRSASDQAYQPSAVRTIRIPLQAAREVTK